MRDECHEMLHKYKVINVENQKKQIKMKMFNGRDVRMDKRSRCINVVWLHSMDCMSQCSNQIRHIVDG